MRVRVVLLLTAILTLLSSSAHAQDTNVTLIIDNNNLTVYVPGGQTATLTGFAFGVLVNDQTVTYPLSGYRAFNIPLAGLPTPICFRLVRADSDSPAPLACDGHTNLIERLQDVDVFWHDNSDNQRRSFTVSSDDTIVTICPAGQSSCELNYAAPTPTPTPPPTATPSPADLVDAALAAWSDSPQTNADWTPLERDFDGVTMVLVPPGCFMMGSTEGHRSEQPVHQQCFDEPYWIDKYEVTNAQFGSTGCTTEPDEPRNCINWFDARDHCLSRNARLPNEAEWEYAARGTDGLVFPWGNEWNPDNANWVGTSPEALFAVGSFPGGASWVGALDMSGNAWEWTASISDGDQFPYPFADDGRNDTSDVSGLEGSLRIQRGGGFRVDVDFLRSSDRYGIGTYYETDQSGLRCIRSFA